MGLLVPAGENDAKRAALQLLDLGRGPEVKSACLFLSFSCEDLEGFNDMGHKMGI